MPSSLLLPRTWQITITGRTDQPDNAVLRAQLLSAVSLNIPLGATVAHVNVEVHDGAPAAPAVVPFPKGGGPDV